MSSIGSYSNATLPIHSGLVTGNPEVAKIVSEMDTTLTIQVAITMLLVYDTIITMDMEVKYFWTSRNFVSLIYFMNRYIGIFSAITGIPLVLLNTSKIMCTVSFWVYDISNTVVILLIDYILLLRVVALFHGDRRMDISLKVMFGLNAASGFGILIFGSIKEAFGAIDLLGSITVCSANGHSLFLLATLSWTIPLIYGSILMVLALYKATKYWKESSSLSGYGLIRVLIQDQVFYFLVVIFCSAGRIIATATNLDSVLSIVLNVATSSSILCVLGSRLLIHMKEAGERGENGGTSYRIRPVSDIEFS